MKLAYIALVALLPVAAQEFRIPATLDRLADKATEVVDVTLDGSMLQLASRFLSDKDPDEARVKKLVAGLKGVYVKSFEFEKAGEYEESDVIALRAQLKGPRWSRIVGVRSKKNGDNADIFIGSDGGQVTGLVVIAAEPRELTVVSIVGSIKPEDLRDLGGNFGIPRMEIGPWSPHKGGASGTSAKEE
jgi:hypothetical protein